jgi:hypothetical protein
LLEEREGLVAKLAKADPEVAAATFAEHLDAFWSTGRPQALGMERTKIDSLHSVVSLSAKRSIAKTDRYFVLLGAEYYDAYPPTVMFVQPIEPDGWLEAKNRTVWYPTIKFPPQPPPWFLLHSAQQIEGYSQPRQLVCFSFTAEYYMTNHNPTETQKWVQGRHTVAATLNRLQEVLLPPLYQEPSGS